VILGYTSRLTLWFLCWFENQDSCHHKEFQICLFIVYISQASNTASCEPMVLPIVFVYNVSNITGHIDRLSINNVYICFFSKTHWSSLGKTRNFGLDCSTTFSVDKLLISFQYTFIYLYMEKENIENKYQRRPLGMNNLEV